MSLSATNGRFTISGTIKLANGKPASGISISAFNMDLRSETEIGKAITDKEGSFTIDYTAEFKSTEYRTADIFFRLSTDSRQEITKFHLYKFKKNQRDIIGSPQVIFNAGKNERVEIELTTEEIYKGNSEFEEIAHTIRPLLSEVRLEELSENEKHRDISFISGETEIEKELVYKFVIAHRLAAQSKIAPEFWYGLFSGALYTNLIAGLTTNDIDKRMAIIISTLPSISSQQAKKIIEEAIAANKINESLKEKIDTWIREFANFVAQRLARPEQSDTKIFIHQVSQLAGLNEDINRQFLRACQEHEGPVTGLWKKLRQDKVIPEKDIVLLETSFHLTDLAGNNFSTAKALREKFNIDTPAQLQQAAKLSQDELEQFISEQQRAGNIIIPEHMVGQNTEAKVHSYAQTTYRNFKESFPTASFLGNLERALQGRERPSIPQAENMQKFLAAHPDFDLSGTAVDAYLDNDTLPETQVLKREGTFRQQLKSVQRIFKLAPDYEAANTLLKDDLHSAAQIYRQGKKSFVKKYEKQPGFTTQLANETYNKAANTHAAVVTVVAELKSLESAGVVQALQDNEAAVNAFPNWQNLFGKADICECEHCRSVYSPGAYFADLLMFLKNRTWGMVSPFNNSKDVLFERRSDLGYLELSCENANTPLPYIDVVNEVLEDVVADGADDVELIGLTAIPADQTLARPAVANAFLNVGIELATDFILSPIAGIDEYMVRDTAITYLLKKKATPNYFYEVTRQTKVPADELRAYPQYIKPSAYQTLSSAVYPWAASRSR